MWRIGLVLLVLAAAGRAQSGPKFYLATQDTTARPGVGNLVASVDPATGQVTGERLTVDREGRPVQMFDIAVDREQQLWGVDSTQGLWKIDARTGLCTKVAERLVGGPTNINAMTFHPGTGDLYVAGNAAGVYRLNVATCDGVQCAPLVEMSKAPYPSNTCAGDIEFHRGDLYFAGEFSILYRLKAGEDELWYADAASEVVSAGVGTAFVMKGLASDGETLFVAGDANQAEYGHYIAVVDTERLTFGQAVPILTSGKTLVVGLGVAPSTPRATEPARPFRAGVTSHRAPARPSWWPRVSPVD